MNWKAITIHILSSISRSIGNPTMKPGQLIDYCFEKKFSPKIIIQEMR